MGKIPEYQRNKFISSYVGAPQMDTSGAEMAAGVSKAAGAVVDMQAKKLQERATRIIDAQANRAVLDFSLAYQRQAKELERQYADNPQDFPQALIAMGEELAAEYGKTLKDERVAARFGGAANTVIRQSGNAALGWAQAKQEENALIAAQEAGRTLILTTGQSANYDEFINNMTVAEADFKSRNIPQKEINTQLRGAMDSYLYNMAKHYPDQLQDEFDEGKYKDLPFFDHDMKVKFESAITTQKRHEKREEQQAQTDTFYRVSDAIFDRKLPFTDLLTMLDEEKPNMREKDFDRARKALFNKVVAEIKDLRDEKPGAEKYVKAVMDGAEGKVDETKYMAQILDIYEDGVDPTELKQLTAMRRDLVGPSGGEKLAEEVKKYAGYLDPLFKGAAIPQAKALMRFMSAVREGKDPRVVREEQTKQVTVDKVLADNPSLAGSKDPVEESYFVQARKGLEEAFGSYTEEQLRRAVEILKNRGMAK